MSGSNIITTQLSKILTCVSFAQIRSQYYIESIKYSPILSFCFLVKYITESTRPLTQRIHNKKCCHVPITTTNI